jgi:hypothetical protein
MDQSNVVVRVLAHAARESVQFCEVSILTRETRRVARSDYLCLCTAAPHDNA